MKKIISSLLVLLTTVVAVGGSTSAFYQDTETSSDNFFGSSLLDLKIQDNNQTYRDGVTATWTNGCGALAQQYNELDDSMCEDMKPGDEFEFKIPLVNLVKTANSIEADHMELHTEYRVDETTNPVAGDTNPNTDATPDDFAQHMHITRMNYYDAFSFCIDLLTGTQYPSYDPIDEVCTGAPVTQNNDWKIGRDLTATSTFKDLMDTDGLDNLPPANDVTNFELSLAFDSAAGNDLQGDIFDFDLLFTLNQDASQ